MVEFAFVFVEKNPVRRDLETGGWELIKLIRVLACRQAGIPAIV
jgi:hypothetical protein